MDYRDAPVGFHRISSGVAGEPRRLRTLHEIGHVGAGRKFNVVQNLVAFEIDVFLDLVGLRPRCAADTHNRYPAWRLQSRFVRHSRFPAASKCGHGGVWPYYSGPSAKRCRELRLSPATSTSARRDNRDLRRPRAFRKRDRRDFAVACVHPAARNAREISSSEPMNIRLITSDSRLEFCAVGVRTGIFVYHRFQHGAHFFRKMAGGFRGFRELIAVERLVQNASVSSTPDG